jgi:GntR family transcriptional regulator
METVQFKSAVKIDKDSEIPYYYQLKKLIIEEIESGHWKPGQKIMPEIKICEVLDISRTVVRQTYQELVNEGYLLKKKAKGTFVSEPKISENIIQSLMGFYEDMSARGFKVENKVLRQEVIPATEKVAKELNLQKGTKVITINRLRKLNGEPILIDTDYLPYELCPDLLEVDLTNQSLYAYLEKKHNIKIDRGRRYISAAIAGANESKLLKVKKGSPLVLIDSISYLKDGKAIEYYNALHRGDRTKFVIELKRVMKNDEIKNIPVDSTISGLLIIPNQN